MSNLAKQLQRQGSTKATLAKAVPKKVSPPPKTESDSYRPDVRKLSAELPADEFKWVRVTAAERDTNATAIVRGLLLLARKDPKVLNAALDALST